MRSPDRGGVDPHIAARSNRNSNGSLVLGQVQDMATGRRHVHEGHSPLGALMIFNLLLSMAAFVWLVRYR